MIVDIAVAPQALTDIAYGQLKFGSVAASNVLKECVQAHGVLIFPSSAEIGNFVEAIKSSDLLTTTERNRWLTFLSLLHQQHRLIPDALPSGFKINEADAESDIAALAGAGEKVIVLSDLLFERLFPADHDGTHELPGGVSATTGGTVSEAASIDKRRKLAQTAHHPSGTSREQIWSELFEPLTHRCKTVTVLDRYMFSEAAKRDSAGRQTGRQDEHLIWLLKRVAASAPIGTRVQLFGGYGDEPRLPTTAESVAEMIIRQWNEEPGAITELEVTVANWKVDRELPHDRHIRFGPFSYTLTAGLDRLINPIVNYRDGLNWAYKWDTKTEQTFSGRELRVAQSRSASTFRKTLP